MLLLCSTAIVRGLADSSPESLEGLFARCCTVERCPGPMQQKGEFQVGGAGAVMGCSGGLPTSVILSARRRRYPFLALTATVLELKLLSGFFWRRVLTSHV